MSATLRDQLLAAPTKPAGTFTLEGSGVVVYLRRWSLADRLAVTRQDPSRPFAERQLELLALVLCDEHNAPLFASGDTALQTLALGADAERLFEAAIEANGLGAKSLEKKPPS